MHPNPPSGKRTFAWFRDHPGWSAAGAIATIVAVVVAVLHDLFGFSFDSKEATAPPPSAAAPSHLIPSSQPITVPRTSGSPRTSGVKPKPSVTKPAGGAKSPTPEPTCTQRIKITAPSEGRQVVGEDGVELRGTACGLRTGEVGWIFDYDPFDDYYYSADSPAIVGNGTWAYRNQPIGDKGDNNKFYTLQMVLASSGCNEVIARVPVNDEGDKRLRRSDFPSSCVFADAVNVSVTWPP